MSEIFLFRPAVKPTLVLGTQVFERLEFSNVTFNFSIQSPVYPNPTADNVMWTNPKGSVIADISKYVFSADHRTLMVKDLIRNDDGVYWMTVRNSGGQSRTSFNLTVYGNITCHVSVIIAARKIETKLKWWFLSYSLVTRTHIFTQLEVPQLTQQQHLWRSLPRHKGKRSTLGVENYTFLLLASLVCREPTFLIIVHILLFMHIRNPCRLTMQYAERKQHVDYVYIETFAGLGRWSWTSTKYDMCWLLAGLCSTSVSSDSLCPCHSVI